MPSEAGPSGNWESYTGSSLVKLYFCVKLHWRRKKETLCQVTLAKKERNKEKKQRAKSQEPKKEGTGDLKELGRRGMAGKDARERCSSRFVWPRPLNVFSPSLLLVRDNFR